MCRKDLLNDISNTFEELGFYESKSKQPMTYQRNVKYPSIFSNKSDYAHFVLYTTMRTIQVVVKFQESNGTAIEKLGYTIIDAARSSYDDYLVVCGGSELLKHDRAVEFLNSYRSTAPKLTAITVKELASFIGPDLGSNAA
ncbi:hypothetical protein F0225_18665 [Vibrio pectenicida]|uniref:PD-(D/E)XK nuclease domain-containing protein n=1 Tax=Vibrio pectenicida TaxID=62763 RepID=A0A7Y4EF20_9VIBR|nr:PD-(D/E)XK nuclease superfamily protein [Vibrio pectenicida]NOH73340.1 hypothetical protein [Vibrio pectenicida]